jgi:hypothetical protein
MMTMRAAFAGVLLLLGSGCQDHFTTQEAYEICDELTERNPGTNPPEAFLDCVACYETCGEECAVTGETPQQYVCPDEVPVDEDGEGGGQ